MISFFKTPDKRKKYLLIGIDSVGVGLGLFISFVVEYIRRGDFSSFISTFSRLTPLSLVLAIFNLLVLFLGVVLSLSIVYVITAYVAGAYEIDAVFNKKRNIVRLGGVVTASGVLSYSLTNVLLGPLFSNSIWLFFVFFLFVFLIAWRALFFRFFVVRNPYRILIIEKDHLGGMASEFLGRGGNATAFYIKEATEEKFFSGLEAENYNHWKKFDLLVYPFLKELSHEHMISLVKSKFWGIASCSSLTYFVNATGRIPVFDIGPRWLVDLSVSIALSRPLQRRVKRILDLLFSFAGIVLFLPLMLIIALLIKITSKGPILFIHERVGLHERLFPIYKFRTMVDNAEKDTGPVWAQKNDPRTTALGKVLRKTRLDELPQLFNVLKGEISFIGPRPIRKFFEDQHLKIIPFYFIRHLVKPGLTGWAQVSDIDPRAEDGPHKRLEYDLYYMHEYSLFLDAFIIIKTIQKVLWGKGQ